MRAPFAETWSAKRKRTGRRTGRADFAALAARAAALAFAGRASEAAPERAGEPEAARGEAEARISSTAKTGDAAKDGSKRAAFGAALLLAKVVFALAGCPRLNPLRKGRYFLNNHRKELSAGVSSYLAHLLFAACSRRPMAPVEQYCRKLDKLSANQEERTALEKQLTYDDERGGVCYIRADIMAIENALGIKFDAAEVSAIFPAEKNGNGLRSIDQQTLRAALAARGVTVEPLRLIMLRLFDTGRPQRLKDIDVICGQPMELDARLGNLQRLQDRVRQMGVCEEVRPLRLPRAPPANKKRASGKRKPKPKPKAKRKPAPKRAESPELEESDEERAADQERPAEEQRPAVEEHPADEQRAADADGDAESDDEKEEDVETEDAGWSFAMLQEEMARLPEEAREAMQALIPLLHVRLLVDTEVRAAKAPELMPPPWLRKRDRAAQLADWVAFAAKVAAAEVSGSRLLGFEVVLLRPGQAPRVLFACLGEVQRQVDLHGRHAVLSYLEGDRTVLPDGTPGAVPSAIFRAFMLSMAAKLLRCGATQLWLSACSPQWAVSTRDGKMYPEPFLVASSAAARGEPVPRSLGRAGVDALLQSAKEHWDGRLCDTVYPTLLQRGTELGLMAPGAGKYEGTGWDVPCFADEVFTKRLLEPAEADHPRPAASLVETELAASNKVAQIFTATLAIPERLSRNAERFSAMLSAAQQAPDALLAKYNSERAKDLAGYVDIAMKQKRVPRDFQTLGQLARFKVRDGYLKMQTGALAA